MNFAPLWASRLWLGLLWFWLLLVALWLRPLLPVDETRYVSVAWEMWSRGEFLLPLLNGEPYSHKPPLLFWLIHLGWWLFGVNDLWPRLVIPLLSLLNLGLTLQLARQWWPQDRQALQWLPWLLFGTLVWSGFYTLVQFDQLLVTAVLMAMLGLVRASRHARAGWWLLGLGIGLGALAKGPVILLHVVPVALLAPVWRPAAAARGWRWYGGVLFSLFLGVALALAWAIPAALQGGEAYRHAISWGQHASRLGKEADHAQPIWWYLLLLPLMCLPWTAWPRVWRSLAALPANEGVRFCLAWAIPVVLLFSLVGGKQGKYLLPMLPAVALLMAHALSAWRPLSEKQGAARLWGPAVVAMVSGLLIWFAPQLFGKVRWIAQLETYWGAALVMAGIVLLARSWSPARAVPILVLFSVLFWTVAHLSVLQAMAPSVDLKPMSQRLAQLQQAGHPIGINLEYAGQFHWLGRLRQPLVLLRTPADFQAWLQPGPESYVIVHEQEWLSLFPPAEFVQAYRSGALVLLKTSHLAAYKQARGESGWARYQRQP